MNPTLSGLLEAIARPAGTSDWMGQAACRNVPPDVFHTNDPDGIAHAKTWCDDCPVKRECLNHAVRLGHGALGVWAGTTLNQRLTIRGRRSAQQAMAS